MLEQTVDLRIALRQALNPLAEFGRILEHLRQAETIAERLGDRCRLAQVSSLMAFSFSVLGEHDRAIETGRRALAVAEALGDIPLQVVTHFNLALPYRYRGDYRHAIDHFKWNATALAGELLGERLGLAGYPATTSRAWLAWCLAELGDFTEGITYGEEAVRMAEALDHPYSLATSLLHLGAVYTRRGNMHKAVPILERSLDLSRTWDLPQIFAFVATRLGSAYTLSGRVAAGVRVLEQATEQAAAGGMMAEESLAVACLSEAYLVASRLQDAIRLADRALTLVTKQKERGHQAWILRLLGEIALYREPLDLEQADASYRQALTLAEELGMRPLQAHCHLGLGTLYQKVRRPEQARAELASAIDLYRSMEMSFWLPRAEAELAKAG